MFEIFTVRLGQERMVAFDLDLDQATCIDLYAWMKTHAPDIVIRALKRKKMKKKDWLHLVRQTQKQKQPLGSKGQKKRRQPTQKEKAPPPLKKQKMESQPLLRLFQEEPMQQHTKFVPNVFQTSQSFTLLDTKPSFSKKRVSSSFDLGWKQTHSTIPLQDTLNQAKQLFDLSRSSSSSSSFYTPPAPPRALVEEREERPNTPVLVLKSKHPERNTTPSFYFWCFFLGVGFLSSIFFHWYLKRVSFCDSDSNTFRLSLPSPSPRHPFQFWGVSSPCLPCPPQGTCVNGFLACEAQYEKTKDGLHCVLKDEFSKTSFDWSQKTLRYLEEQNGQKLCHVLNVESLLPNFLFQMTEKQLNAFLIRQFYEDKSIKQKRYADLKLLIRESKRLLETDPLFHASVYVHTQANVSLSSKIYTARKASFSWMCRFQRVGKKHRTSLFFLFLCIFICILHLIRRNECQMIEQLYVLVEEELKRQGQPIAVQHLKDQLFSLFFLHASWITQWRKEGLWTKLEQMIEQDSRIQTLYLKHQYTTRKSWKWVAFFTDDVDQTVFKAS